MKRTKRSKRIDEEDNGKKWQRPANEPKNRHHRRPKSRSGSSDPANISVVPIRHHHAYNLLFGSNPLPHEVAKVLTDTWIDPNYKIVVMHKGEELHCEEKHDCTACPNYQLRQMLNPMMKVMAQEALTRAFQ